MGQAYWNAMVQLLPILGLAHVVEARQLIKGAGAWPRWYRLVVGILHFACLSALGLGIYVSLVVLQGGLSARIGWIRSAMLQAVVYSVGVLILSPAMQALAFAFAGPAAKILSLYPRGLVDRWDSRRLLRRYESQISRLRKLHREAAAALSTLQSQRAGALHGRQEVSDQMAHVDPNSPRRRELEVYLNKVDKWLIDNLKTLERAQAIIDELPDVAEAEMDLAAAKDSDARFEAKIAEAVKARQRIRERVFLAAAGVSPDSLAELRRADETGDVSKRARSRRRASLRRANARMPRTGPQRAKRARTRTAGGGAQRRP